MVFDNTSYFNYVDITYYALENGIKVKYYANYYPQGNGLVESSNKIMINILKKTMATHHKDWHTNLFNSLWVDSITPKVSIGNSPYYLVYGKEFVLPSNLLLPSLHLAHSFSQDDGSSPLQNLIDTLHRLEEEREKYINTLYEHQQIVKGWFDDKSSSNLYFQVGDLVHFLGQTPQRQK